MLGLLGVIVAWTGLLSLPASAWACAPGPGPGSVVAPVLPPIEFLGRLTSLQPVPAPTGSFRPLYRESTVSFAVLRVFRGSVGPTITLSTTATGLTVGDVYTVPVFSGGGWQSAGMECGPQPQPGNLGRLIGYAPASRSWLRWLGASCLAVGAILAALLALPIRRRGSQAP